MLVAMLGTATLLGALFVDMQESDSAGNDPPGLKVFSRPIPGVPEPVGIGHNWFWRNYLLEGYPALVLAWRLKNGLTVEQAARMLQVRDAEQTWRDLEEATFEDDVLSRRLFRNLERLMNIPASRSRTLHDAWWGENRDLWIISMKGGKEEIPSERIRLLSLSLTPEQLGIEAPSFQVTRGRGLPPVPRKQARSKSRSATPALKKRKKGKYSDAQIRKLNAEGLTNVEIGRAIGAQPATVARYLQRMGLSTVWDSTAARQLTYSQDQIRELHALGLSSTKIAAAIGSNRGVVSKHLKKMGLLPHRMYSEDQIRGLHALGLSNAGIARVMETDARTVLKYLNGMGLLPNDTWGRESKLAAPVFPAVPVDRAPGRKPKSVPMLPQPGRKSKFVFSRRPQPIPVITDKDVRPAAPAGRSRDVSPVLLLPRTDFDFEEEMLERHREPAWAIDWA